MQKFKNENTRSLFSRMLTYQKERFPLAVYVVIISVFSFSAISYSLLCRGVNNFIPLESFILCVTNALILFFLLRISDEFKDKEDDAQFRSYLPVPRGLVSLGELRWIGFTVVLIQLSLTSYIEPRILWLLLIVYAYMFLMYHEFFAKRWLKKNQFWYVVSHMMIIPLVDVFASGFDWFLAHKPASIGLLLFFGVSFLNGLTLEIGRKIKSPEKEEIGVLSYTFQLGTYRAVYLWMVVIFSTFLGAIVACHFVGHSIYSYAVLSICLLASWVPAILFIKNPNIKRAKGIEYMSSLWTLTLYLTLGGAPMLRQLI